MIAELTARGVPALSETPPAPDLSSLIALNELVGKGAKIQVSEQYHMHPLHASRLSLVEKGLIGDVNHMQISACHGYHAISLIRKFLGLGYENAVISARSITTSLTAGPDRFGIPRQEKLIDSLQVIAMLEFGDKVVLYDFSDDQYFSWIRSNRFLVRGNKGEISNNTIRYLKDFRTPVEIELKRQNAGEYGNLEGYYLKGILAGDEWIYTNPLIPGRLTDDEIGVASCLLKMNRFVREGVSFYSLEEASQDHYLSMMIDKAANTGNKIQTESQIWSF
jgi:Predicted dehydrogenases and related proteins